MNLLSAEKILQTRHFDHLTESVDRVLRDERVQQQIGEFALDLLELNELAVLPNIRHGVIELPKSYKDSDSVAVLPLTPETNTGELVVGESILQPTPYKLEKITEHMNEIVADQASAEPGVCFREKAIAPRLGRATAMALNFFHLNLDTRVVHNSRPLILYDIYASPYDSILNDAAIMAHEYVHAFDAEERVIAPEDLHMMHARDELHAYHVQAKIVRTLFGDPVFNFDYEFEVMPLTVEYERKRHTAGGDPFTPTTELIVKLEKLGVI